MVLISEVNDEHALLPSVHWAQRKETLSFKINVNNAKTPKIDLTETAMSFEVEGSGAKGTNLYKFALQFYKLIDCESCVYHVTPFCVNVQLTKQEGEYWPRLLPNDVKKPHFLKLDFDKWQSESDDEENEKRAQMQNIYDSLDENEKTALLIGNFYLAFYNAVQFVLFSIIVCTCLLGYLFRGNASRVYIYDSIGPLVVFSVLLTYLEPIHSILGLVKSPWILPFMQVSGRCFALLCLWLGDSLVQHSWAVWYLYLAWGFAETIRYPYYMLQIFKKDVALLTWLRYHAWVVLYPVGAFFEFTIFMETRTSFDENDWYSYRLPAPFNFNLKLSTFIRLYVVVLLVGIVTLMRHMNKMRRIKYGKRRKFKAH